MDVLQLLEKKVSQLIQHGQLLKEQLSQATEHNNKLVVEKEALERSYEELLARAESLEVSMLSHSKTLHEEKELARFAVDELIKNIDSLVGPE